MATAYVSIGPLKVPGILDGEISRSATVSTSGTSALSSITAGASEVAIVFCQTAVYARSGGTATAATSVFCPAGIPTAIGMTQGDAVALIDA